MQKTLKEMLIQRREEFGERDLRKANPKKLLKYFTYQRDLILRKKSALSKEDSQWLFENYYLLEKSSLELMRERDSQLSRLIVFTDIFAREAEKADSDSILPLFEVLSQRDFLTERETESIRSALIYSCLSSVYEGLLKKESIGERIELLRGVLQFDFSPFVIGFSPLERYLRCDPAGFYPKMTRETKKAYKRIICTMARREGVSFGEFCARICERASSEGRHVGEYIDVPHPSPLPFYLMAGLLFFAFLSLSVGLVFSFAQPVVSIVLLILLLPAVFETSWHLASFFISFVRKSEPLFCMELEKIDKENSTLVTIPCLLSSKEEVDKLFLHLEKLFLKARVSEGDEVVFSLLGDFAESDVKKRREDKELVELAFRWVDKLNEKHGNYFAFFTREREKDPSSGKYMPRERKRGALLQLARFAVGKKSALIHHGESGDGFKYILTLDADTDMGLSDLYKMIGTMAHPLNRPVVEVHDGVPRVVRGYGILEPLIAPSLAAAYSTPFSLLISGAAGFDSYHGPAFDLHHALHARAMFCGKGIFDAEVYLTVLENAFPDGIVLSHDMLEGSRLRCGFLSDMVFVDDVPKNAVSYYKRAHRWARGDVQSLIFTTPYVYDRLGNRVKNPQPTSDRLVFYVNFISLLVPIFSSLALFLSMTDTKTSGAVFVIATSPLWLYSSLGFIMCLLRFSFSGIYRRFFTEALTSVRREVLHFLYSLSSLAFRAWKNFNAIFLSFWRCAVSGKKRLEWTTASEAESSLKKGSVSYYFVQMLPSSIAGAVFLVFSVSPAVRLLGVLFSSFFLISYFTSKKRKNGYSVSPSERERIMRYAKSSWEYFATHVSGETNFLPPDNVSVKPSHTPAMRTSPTNIGLYLVSVLAARDFGFIKTGELVSRLSDTLETLERLPKYRGQLYNWYDISNCTVLGNPYISSVDSGNFVTCLVCLTEGLLEYEGEHKDIPEIVSRLSRLEKEADFKFLYDKSRRLFSLGCNVEKNERERGCYDLYMSEMRTTDYYAVARGIVPKEHWSALSRPLITKGSLLGAASWSGTAFEYFMPHLFLPVFENSFADEALSFAFAEQVQFSHLGVFGISESGYFAFDRDMNYQYRAFGTPSLSLRRERERDMVFSPYSTFLMMSRNLSLCLKNLSRLEKLGMWGEFGFYEAIDFNPERAGGGHALVKSYMAHHVGMSIVSCANAVLDNIFVKRFIRRGDMGSATELLQEKIPVDAVVLKKSVFEQQEIRTLPRFTQHDSQSLCRGCERRASALLVGRDINMTLCERGVVGVQDALISYLRPYSRSGFMSLVPWGISDRGIASPLHGNNRRFLYGKGFAQYQNEAGTLFLNLSSTASAIKARVSVKREKGQVQKGIYVEPSLVSRGAYTSHPAYSDLFFKARYDSESHALFLERTGSRKEVMCLVSNENFEFEISRERVFEKREANKDSLFDYIKKTHRFTSSASLPLSPCILVRSLDTKSGDVLFVLGFGKSESEALANARLELSKSQHKSFSDCDEYELRLMRAAGVDGQDYDLSERILNSILFFNSPRRVLSRPASYGREKLWELGVSGDFPIICVSATLPEKTLSKILTLHKLHYISGLLYDLIIICRDSGYEQPEHDTVSRLLDSTRTRFMENLRGGIFVAGGEWYEVLKPFDIIESEADIEKKSESLERECLKPSPIHKTGGKCTFSPDGYVIDKTDYNPSVLWHHIIASNSFGTLLSHRSLGHTWVYNAALSKLTLWENDRVGGGFSEKIFLTRAGRRSDMCLDSTEVFFNAGEAIFKSDNYELHVSVHPKLLFKQVRVMFFFEGNVTLAYQAPFVMGDGVAEATGISFWEKEKGVFFSSPFSESLKDGFGYLVFQGEGEARGNGTGLAVSMSVKDGDEAVFLLGYARGEKHFEHIFKNPVPSAQVEAESRDYARRFLKDRVKTGLGENTDSLYNLWLPLQCAVSRFTARTGPYQSGGAWGARDQAQDALFLIDRVPSLVRSHIFRICAHQYKEGDVQHWWHGFRGTRTLCSDDYLWLVLLVSLYVEKTGDESVLEVEVSYLDTPSLSKNERERYEKAVRGEVRERVIDHVQRALRLFLERGVGEHGLPYMLSGDWNDGMNSVGENGGESVWLGFFALIVFEKAYPILEKYGFDTAEYREFCDRLFESIDKNAFFTDRYARAFLSDKTVLGVLGCEACAIDGLVQAAASICYHVTGRGDVAKISAALDSAYRELYDSEKRIFKLFFPAFKKPDLRIGYVSLYPDGVRENGGQYTHAAVWSALSYLWAPCEKKKNRKRALEILSCLLPTDREPEVFKTEPYVLSADIYSNPDAAGRGGWSFYTGSAGWCARLIEEIINSGEKQE